MRGGNNSSRPQERPKQAREAPDFKENGNGSGENHRYRPGHLTPSVIAFTDKGEVLVGDPAKRHPAVPSQSRLRLA